MAAPLTVAMAERVERSRGPKAGYVVWKGLADVSTSSAVRGPALLGALRCAIQLADVNVVFDLATAWRTSRVTGPAPELFEHCRALAREGHAPAARALAEAEVARRPSARALYLHARLLERAGDVAAALSRYAEAARAGEEERAPSLVRASRVRRLALAWRARVPVADLVEEAGVVDLGGASEPERLVVARMLLRSPSRYLRAGDRPRSRRAGRRGRRHARHTRPAHARRAPGHRR